MLGSGSSSGRSALDLGRELAARGRCAAWPRRRSTSWAACPAWDRRGDPRPALEAARLAAEQGLRRTIFLRSPEEAGRYLLPRYAARPVETFGLLLLDVRHGLLRESVVSVGCLTSSLVHPREVFREALDARAAAVVAFHNHLLRRPRALRQRTWRSRVAWLPPAA